MNVRFDKLNEVTAEVVVSLSEDDYKNKVTKQLKEIGAKRPEPGFRAGHVPMGILVKKYGQGVKYDVINREVSDALFDYIQKNNIRVLGNPVPVKDENFDLKNTDFEFKFEVGMAPELNIEVDKTLELPFYTIKPTEEMIASRDEALRRRFGKQVSADTMEEDAVVKGVITELDADGAPKAEGIVVENGIVSPKYFKSEEQRKLFEGKHVGDVITFNPAATCDSNPAEIASMLGIEKNDVDAHKGDFTFDIKDFIVLRPAELDEEFYEMAFGKDIVHNEEEYKAAIKDMVVKSLEADSNYRFSIDAKEALMKKAGDIDLPADVLKRYLMMRNEGMTEEQADAEFAKAEPMLKLDLVRDAVAKKLSIEVAEEDLKQMARTLARDQFAQYGMTNAPETMIDNYAERILKDDNYREGIVNQAFDVKLFNGVRAVANVESKEVTVEEFNKLFIPADNIVLNKI